MAKASKAAGPTSLQFFDRLRWLDGTPLLDGIEPYRREIFSKALDTFRPDGTPAYNMVLAGRAKKNNKTLDLVLAGLFVLVIRRSVQGSDGFILSNSSDQSLDDLTLAKRLIACNPALASEIEVMATELRLRDGSAILKILPAANTVGMHGKRAAFIGYDEIHGYRDWSLMEALQPDPTQTASLQWVTTYASLYSSTGAPLHDLMTIGKAGSDPRMLFSWYSGDYTTDLTFTDLPPLERANPSMSSWPDGIGYLQQQRTRLPSGRFRRLHLNLGGSPEGCAYDQATVLACVVTGRKSLPYREGVRYVAAVDLSHGSNDDACLCVSHVEGKIVVIDAVVKQNGTPPFNPHDAVAQFCEVLKDFRISTVTGDAVGGEVYRLDFQGRGVRYVVNTTSASDLYELLEPRLNAAEIELLDAPVPIEQLIGLVWRGSKITHEHHSHDDHANAIALAALVAAGGHTALIGLEAALSAVTRATPSRAVFPGTTEPNLRRKTTCSWTHQSSAPRLRPGTQNLPMYFAGSG